MYPAGMRRIQFCIPEDLDDLLQLEAAKLKRSKGSLIRECISARFCNDWQGADDPVSTLIGTVDVDPEDVDSVVYGGRDLTTLDSG